MLLKKMIVTTVQGLRLVRHEQRAAAINQGDADALISPGSFGTGCDWTHRMELENMGRGRVGWLGVGAESCVFILITHTHAKCTNLINQLSKNLCRLSPPPPSPTGVFSAHVCLPPADQ